MPLTVVPAPNALVLTWTIPEGRYTSTVKWRKVGTLGWFQITPVSLTGATLTGLDPVAYDVQVALLGPGAGTILSGRGTPLAPPPPKPAPAPKVLIGINDGLGWGPPSAQLLKDNHIAVVRGTFDFDTEKPASLLAAGLTPGVVVIGNTDDGVKLAGTSIATWLGNAEAQADDAVASCGASVPLEVGNEMYLKGGQADPASYARMFQALAQARPNYTLLFSSFGDYSRPNGSWSQQDSGGGWLGDALKTAPSLATQIKGFVNHPYGDMKPVPANGGNSEGPGALVAQHDYAVKLGFTHADQWWLTEYGSSYPYANDGDPQDADCAAAYTYFMSLPYVRGIFWFQFRDYDGMNPPHTGAFNDNFTPRPVVKLLKTIAIAQGQ